MQYASWKSGVGLAGCDGEERVEWDREVGDVAPEEEA